MITRIYEGTNQTQRLVTAHPLRCPKEAVGKVVGHR
jgi:hypothetical protein